MPNAASDADVTWFEENLENLLAHHTNSRKDLWRLKVRLAVTVITVAILTSFVRITDMEPEKYIDLFPAVSLSLLPGRGPISTLWVINSRGKMLARAANYYFSILAPEAKRVAREAARERVEKLPKSWRKILVALDAEIVKDPSAACTSATSLASVGQSPVGNSSTTGHSSTSRARSQVQREDAGR